jgi:hypothetical protein
MLRHAGEDQYWPPAVEADLLSAHFKSGEMIGYYWMLLPEPGAEIG